MYVGVSVALSRRELVMTVEFFLVFEIDVGVEVEVRDV